MKKKLMVAAVAGALAVPALAFAQAGQVQIYGYLNAEYGWVDQPDAGVAGAPIDRETTDAFNSGASRIGFRTEEKLGSGLSAWGQCESQVNGAFSLGTAQSGWCNRNTAVGLKGSWGNFFVGRWDSPLKRAHGAVRIFNEAGYLGATNMLLGGQTPTAGEFDFSRRNTHSLNYDSPNFGGFTFSAQTTATHGAVNEAADAPIKGRANSIGVRYGAGPLVVTAGYAKHDDSQTDVAGGAGNQSERAYAVGATYRIGAFRGGLLYTDVDADTGAGTDVKKRAVNVALDYDMPGPGLIRGGVTHAGPWRGSGGAADSGAQQYQIGYRHSLSKRTNTGLSYVRVENDDGGTWNLTNFPAGPGEVLPGDSVSAIVWHLTHIF
jgi:predicted porin